MDYDFTYTGAEIQAILDTAKKLKDSGYIFLGVATPSTNPSTPTQKVYYEAKQAGTYTNFGGVVLPDGISLLKWNGSWTSETVMCGDGGVFDISVYKSSGGTLATFADLAAALDGGNNIPASARKGGMSVKFVQSSDNKYVQFRLMTTEWSTDEGDWAVMNGDVYVENPEYIAAWTDAVGHLFFWVRVEDGGIDWAVGVPKPVKDYVDSKVAEIWNGNEGTTIDSLNKVIAFLDNFSTSDTLVALLGAKVNKVEGKGLIDEDVAAGVNYVENPEYIDVETDSEGRILEAHEKDGTKDFRTDVKVAGKAIFNDVKIRGEVQTEGDFSIKDANIDAETYQIRQIESPEYIDIESDNDSNVLGGRKNDGKKFERVGFETPRISVGGVNIETIDDPDGRMDLGLDGEKRIIHYHSKDGVLHENVGIETPYIKVKNFDLTEKLKKQIKVIADTKIKDYNLPKFGYVYIVSETFYLTADARYSDKNGIYLIQDYPDTGENAANKVTLSNFYIKSTLTDNGDGTYSKNENSVKLDFYAASKVTKLNGIYYVTSSLTEILDPETGEVTGYEVNVNSIEVTQITDIPPYKAWPVDKKTEHYCVVNIDFGDYLSGNFYVGVKYQGSSTLLLRKRNFRFTFYKNNKYEKKNKIKIGEFVRLSGFNLKANAMDNTRIKEQVMNILIMAIWEHREVYDQYPWNKEHTPYTGATGMIKGFPIECKVGGEFYGLDIFGLKKDGKNYILDKDSDGMIEGGTRGGAGDTTNWTDARPIDWEDELNDEEDWVIENQTQSNYDALTTFFAFINERLYNGSDGNTYNSTQLTEVDGTMYVTSTLEGSVPVASSVSATLIPFDKKTMPDRMNMLDWIDYLICLQVFFMRDNTCRNVMLYTGADKKKFYPFFYDLDLSWNFTDENYNADIMIPRTSEPPVGSFAGDMSLWENIKAEWWDEIINRYNELRRSVLTDDYIKAVYESVSNSIPKEIIKDESERWGTQIVDFNEKYRLLLKRLEWLDNIYYK